MQKSSPKCELVRITTKDGLELQGLLFEPQLKTKKAIIHIHGWVGNFYENKFIDFIAEECVRNGIAFLTFNNRGAGIVTEFKHGTEYIKIGGSLERFDDCILDISAAVGFMKKGGYRNIILEGHSGSCQKITYYQLRTKDETIKGLVELAPVDDAAVSRKLLGGRYAEAMETARKMVKEGKENEPVPEWMAFYPLLSAKTFLTVADPKSSSGRIFNYAGKLNELRSISCSMLAVFGTKDDYQEKPEEKLRMLKAVVKNCSTYLVEGAGHGFAGHEKELAKAVVAWAKRQ